MASVPVPPPYVSKRRIHPPFSHTTPMSCARKLRGVDMTTAVHMWMERVNPKPLSMSLTKHNNKLASLTT